LLRARFHAIIRFTSCFSMAGLIFDFVQSNLSKVLQSSSLVSIPLRVTTSVNK
jgi:hypothetical protein